MSCSFRACPVSNNYIAILNRYTIEVTVTDKAGFSGSLSTTVIVVL
jgi:hypothetical protein